MNCHRYKGRAQSFYWMQMTFQGDVPCNIHWCTRLCNVYMHVQLMYWLIQNRRFFCRRSIISCTSHDVSALVCEGNTVAN